MACDPVTRDSEGLSALLTIDATVDRERGSVGYWRLESLVRPLPEPGHWSRAIRALAGNLAGKPGLRKRE